MTSTAQLLQSLRAHPRVAGALAFALALLGGALVLQQHAANEAQARQLPEVRAFEAGAPAWLHNEKSVADFRRSLAAHELTAVGLAAAMPGLVLYTLKTGEKASTTVPGCTPAGCAGTLLDGLGERSAEAGFALVNVHVDPRTTSHRLIDGAQTVLSPLLLIGAVLGALFVATRLQMGLGGASMLTVQPPTRFADVVKAIEIDVPVGDAGDEHVLARSREVLVCHDSVVGGALVAKGALQNAVAEFAEITVQNVFPVAVAQEQVSVDVRGVGRQIRRSVCADPGDVLAPRPIAGKGVVGIRHALARIRPTRACVAEDVCADHPLAVTTGRVVQQRIGSQNLLGRAIEGPGRQTFIEGDAIALRFTHWVEAGTIDQLEEELLGARKRRHKIYLGCGPVENSRQRRRELATISRLFRPTVVYIEPTNMVNDGKQPIRAKSGLSRSLKFDVSLLPPVRV